MPPIASTFAPSGLTLAAAAFDTSQATVLLLALAVLLGLARLLGEWSRQLSLPPIIGEILAGVCLGPTVLGAMTPDIYAMLFPAAGPVGHALEAMFILAAVLLLLVAGLEVELSMVWKQGKSALIVGGVSLVVPLLIGVGMAWMLPAWFGMSLDELGDRRLIFALFIGIALSITALPVIARILMDLNLAKSDIGVIVISAAMLNDLLGWMGFALVLAMMHAGGSTSGAEAAAAGAAAANSAAADVGMTILLTLLFVGGMLTLGRAVFHRVLPYLQAHWSWPGGVLGFVMTVALAGAAFTEHIGIHSIFGAFIAGVALGDCRHLRHQTRRTIEQFITNVFAPLFFVSIGLRVNFVEAFHLKTTLVVLVVAIIGKVVAGYWGARLSGLSPRQGGAIGFAMCARGAMEVILGQLALQTGLIGERTFVAIVIMALVTSLMSGPAIQWLLARKARRRLSDLLTERHYVPQLDARSPRKAIEQLARRAAEVTSLPYDAIVEPVWWREQMMRTGLPGGVAIPHAAIDGLAKPHIFVGRDFEGIDFDASDGSRAQIICLLLSPMDQPDTQVEMIAMVATAFGQAESRSLAIEAESYTEFLAAINYMPENRQDVAQHQH